MKRRLAALAIAVLALTGCGAQPSTGTTRQSNEHAEDISIQTVTLPDGKTVDCIVFSDYKRGGGLECDWDRRR